MVFLKESATEGWWAAPENVNQLIIHAIGALMQRGLLSIIQEAIGSGCLPFHSSSELLTCVNDFAQNSSSPSRPVNLCNILID